MDNKTHKELVIDQAKDIFAKIGALHLHPENKIMLYSRYLLSKVSWYLTVADLTKTWVNPMTYGGGGAFWPRPFDTYSMRQPDLYYFETIKMTLQA